MEPKAHNRTLETQNFNSVEDLYNSITKEGSLGLLALGYQGLLMWRKKRAELGEDLSSNPKEPEKPGQEES